MQKREIYRVLDANFNRSREGLRVCEEIGRFVLNQGALTRRIKKARHAVSDCLKKLPVPYAQLVAARDSKGDVGQESSYLEKKRADAFGLFVANAERAKESLRVLEEYSKLVSPSISKRFKSIRFEIYAIEKEALSKLEALRHNRRVGRQKKTSR